MQRLSILPYRLAVKTILDRCLCTTTVFVNYEEGRVEAYFLII